MNLPDAVVRNVVEVIVGIKAVVLGRDVDVINVEQNPAIGLLCDLREKLPLGHVGLMILCVAADIFDADGNLYKITDVADFSRRVSRDGPGIGHRQEVVSISPIDAAPTEVVGKPRSVCALNEPLETFEMFTVGLFSRAEIHGNAMLNNAVLFENLVEDFQRPTSVAHEILGNDLKPIDDRLLFKDVAVVGYAQADANAVFGEVVKLIGRHGLRWGYELCRAGERSKLFRLKLGVLVFVVHRARHFAAQVNSPTRPGAHDVFDAGT
jgi:hypothetical protein